MRLSDEKLGARVREILGSSVNNAAKFAAICEESMKVTLTRELAKEPAEGSAPTSTSADLDPTPMPPPPPARKKSTRKKTSRRR